MTRAETAGTEPRTAKASAVAFLQAALAGDPVPASQVSRMAREHGLTPKAIRMGREAWRSSATGSDRAAGRCGRCQGGT